MLRFAPMLDLGHVRWIVALSLAGCPADDDGAAGTTGSDVSSSSGGGEASSEGGEASSSGGETSSSGGGASSGGSDLSFEEFSELCQSQTDRMGCEAVPGFESDQVAEPQFGFCLWETSVPVELGEDGTCAFGEPTGRCAVDTASTVGCSTPTSACEGDEENAFYVGVRQTESGPVLIEGDVCINHTDAEMCFIGKGGVEQESPAECACFCDDGWPG